MTDSRYSQAVRAIGIVHDAAPAGASLKDRLVAIDAAYPFGERKYWPYKMWLKARREYIARWSDKPAGPLDARPHLSPLEGQKLRANPTLSGAELRRRGA